MAKKVSLKFVLPNPVEFIRSIHDALLLHQKQAKDSSIEVQPLVSRAKSLVHREGVLQVNTVKETSDG